MEQTEESKLSWTDFLALAKEKDWGIPPNHEIQHAHHYWLLERRYGSGDMPNIKVAQWSPTLRTWFNSNDLASTAKPLNYLREWSVLSRVDLPPLELVAQVWAEYRNGKG